MIYFILMDLKKKHLPGLSNLFFLANCLYFVYLVYFVINSILNF